MKATIYTLFWMMTSMILNIGSAYAQQTPQYIDLGLPSGTLWATCNIGANNPWEYGDYFAWGETTTKKSYSWAFYQYADGNYDKIIKYCNKSFYGNNGHTDKLKTLEKEDDAANANIGPDWSMPTIEQYRELMENCTSEWTYNFNNKGVAGRILKSKKNDSERRWKPNKHRVIRILLVFIAQHRKSGQCRSAILPFRLHQLVQQQFPLLWTVCATGTCHEIKHTKLYPQRPFIPHIRKKISIFVSFCIIFEYLWSEF